MRDNTGNKDDFFGGLDEENNIRIWFEFESSKVSNLCMIWIVCAKCNDGPRDIIDEYFGNIERGNVGDECEISEWCVDGNRDKGEVIGPAVSKIWRFSVIINVEASTHRKQEECVDKYGKF